MAFFWQNPTGSLNPTSALTPDQRAVRILKLKGSMPQKTLAAQFGVDVQVVQRIHQRTTWRHLDATG